MNSKTIVPSDPQFGAWSDWVAQTRQRLHELSQPSSYSEVAIALAEFRINGHPLHLSLLRDIDQWPFLYMKYIEGYAPLPFMPSWADSVVIEPDTGLDVFSVVFSKNFADQVSFSILLDQCIDIDATEELRILIHEPELSLNGHLQLDKSKAAELSKVLNRAGEAFSEATSEKELRRPVAFAAEPELNGVGGGL